MRICLILTLLANLACVAIGAEEESPAKADPFKSVGIELDSTNHQLRVEATICCTQGVLEYLVCLPDTFEHESVFSVRCKPSVLHLCLLSIGLVPRPLDFIPQTKKEAQEQQAASSVSIEVEYELDGKKIRRPVSELFVRRDKKEKAVPNSWIFTGSFFGLQKEKNVYAADVTGGVVGLGQDNTSVIQFGEDVGNPYDEDREEGLEVKPDSIPKRGTKVQLIFTLAQAKPPVGQDLKTPQK